MEQWQEAIELKLRQSAQDLVLEDVETLNGADQLLRECNELLEISTKDENNGQYWCDGEE